MDTNAVIVRTPPHLGLWRAGLLGQAVMYKDSRKTLKESMPVPGWWVRTVAWFFRLSLPKYESLGVPVYALYLFFWQRTTSLPTTC
jgi:hypothetical protein